MAVLVLYTFMAKGKQTYFALICEESNTHNYTISRNKTHIPQGEKMKVSKYCPKLRKHTVHVAKPIKKAAK